MAHHVQLLRRQYLQLVEPAALSFPSSPFCLHSRDFQSTLYTTLLTPTAVQNPPPERYTTRVLKRLITLLTSVPPASEDEEEEPVITPPPAKKLKVSAADNVIIDKKQEIHEGLLELYTELLSRSSSSSSPLDIDASRSYVTYILPPSPYSGREIGQPITLLESRNIISGQGTTGLRTWEAALALGEYLICTHLARIYKNLSFAAAVEGSGTVVRESDSVLELGAGTGLVSIVAARLGATKVLATDGDSSVCEALFKNVGLSGVSDVVTVRKRLWGDEVDTDEKFDLVLGADVTYDSTAISFLVGELERLFRQNPKVKVIISATIRNEDTFTIFEGACRDSNFKLQQRVWTPPRPSMFFYTILAPIRIIHISKNMSN